MRVRVAHVGEDGLGLLFDGVALEHGDGPLVHQRGLVLAVRVGHGLLVVPQISIAAPDVARRRVLDVDVGAAALLVQRVVVGAPRRVVRPPEVVVVEVRAVEARLLAHVRQVVDAAAVEPVEGVEAPVQGRRRVVVVAQVPLADHVRRITQSFQVLGHRRLARRQAPGLGRRDLPVLELEVDGQLAREHGRARRRADLLAVEPVDADAVGHQTVEEGRRLAEVARRVAHVVEAHVVQHDEDDVGARLRRGRELREVLLRLAGGFERGLLVERRRRRVGSGPPRHRGEGEAHGGQQGGPCPGARPAHRAGGGCDAITQWLLDGVQPRRVSRRCLCSPVQSIESCARANEPA